MESPQLLVSGLHDVMVALIDIDDDEAWTVITGCLVQLVALKKRDPLRFAVFNRWLVTYSGIWPRGATRVTATELGVTEKTVNTKLNMLIRDPVLKKFLVWRKLH